MEIALLSQFEHENIVQYYGTDKISHKFGALFTDFNLQKRTFLCHLYFKVLLFGEHDEGYHELSAKTKTFFSTAIAKWDAEFYVKVDDDVHVNLGMSTLCYLKGSGILHPYQPGKKRKDTICIALADDTHDQFKIRMNNVVITPFKTQTRIWLGEVLHKRLHDQLTISDLLADGELLVVATTYCVDFILVESVKVERLFVLVLALFSLYIYSYMTVKSPLKGDE
ncbi:Beta-1,3-galactosyltransferase 7 [Camellia lanceoleosa]|uniref:Beta-1,3-galactosyltransferase 7 n=1 Tax=Camellia lanceoleosa TaxID=1840588 RepID=A0ACC0G012_9ERIC|nr:Beta-1,3-galactosyltransferase 7 [Camellia lanceoleosa]